MPPGPGNISDDPLFVNPPALDFSLDEGSPCIDAGSPYYTDPDGTRSDMGALFCDQRPGAAVELPVAGREQRGTWGALRAVWRR